MLFVAEVGRDRCQLAPWRSCEPGTKNTANIRTLTASRRRPWRSSASWASPSCASGWPTGDWGRTRPSPSPRWSTGVDWRRSPDGATRRSRSRQVPAGADWLPTSVTWLTDVDVISDRLRERMLWINEMYVLILYRAYNRWTWQLQIQNL